MKICLLRAALPFDDAGALKEAKRLHVELLDDIPADAVDVRDCMTVENFLQRRNAMLDRVGERERVFCATVCDADAAGHFMPLGQGCCDLDSYIMALLEKGTAQFVICGVQGTRELEASIRYLKEKNEAYQ